MSTQGLVGGVVSDTDDGVNPRFALEYRPTDSLLTYGLISKGYRIGGVNSGLATGLGAPPTYGPDSLWNYELGFKSTLAGGRMTLNGALYYLDWSDIISVAGIQGFRYRINGDKASVTGQNSSGLFRPRKTGISMPGSVTTIHNWKIIFVATLFPVHLVHLNRTT